MSDVQQSATEREKQFKVRLATPELDERVWLAWKEKHRVEDGIRAAAASPQS